MPSKRKLHNNEDVWNGTSACGWNNNAVKQNQIFVHLSYRRPMSDTLARFGPGAGDAYHSDKMTTVLNSSLFVFYILFLRNYNY